MIRTLALISIREDGRPVISYCPEAGDALSEAERQELEHLAADMRGVLSRAMQRRELEKVKAP